MAPNESPIVYVDTENTKQDINDIFLINLKKETKQSQIKYSLNLFPKIIHHLFTNTKDREKFLQAIDEKGF